MERILLQYHPFSYPPRLGGKLNVGFLSTPVFLAGIGSNSPWASFSELETGNAYFETPYVTFQIRIG